MKNVAYFFFNNDSSQGTISLEEIVVNFESDHPSFDRYTWVRGQEDLYWSTIEYTREIALCLHWDYIDREGKKHSSIKGEELVDFFIQRIIKHDTQIKLSCGSEWKKYKSTVLFENKEYKKYEFHGIAARQPDARNHNARWIDVICYSFFPILFSTLFIKYLVAFVAMMELFCPLLSSFLEAHCISRYGRTMGTKIEGLYVLNSDRTKLTFSRAFSRQWALNSNRGWIYKRQRLKKSLYPFGAIEWDRDHGCIVTEQAPRQ